MKRLAALAALAAASHAGACGYIPADLMQWTRYYARGFGLDERLVAAVIWNESRYCVNALSPKGAIGLGQLMPGTAAGMGIDPYDPVHNIYGTARYLRQQWDTFGDWQLALAAYNAGPGNVKKAGGIPNFPETINYVTKVLATYEAFTHTTLP